MKSDNLTTKEAAFFLGVTIKTLQRWERAGIWNPKRTSGNHRRFSLEDITTLRRIKKRYKHFPKTQTAESSPKQILQNKSLSPINNDHAKRVYELYQKHPDVFVPRKSPQLSFFSPRPQQILIGFLTSLVAIPVLVFLIRLISR